MLPVARIANEITRTFAEATGNPAFAGVIGKPLPTPLDVRFRIAGGYTQTKNGWRRVLVSDIQKEAIRLELDERIGAIVQGFADAPLPSRIVTFGNRPLCVQIPNPVKPAPLAWRADVAATLQRIPLGLSYGWQGAQPMWWDRTQDAHAIIAGVTGSGKSVLLQSILASLVAHISPEALEIVAIDMKGRSLAQFGHAPHLRHAVAYEPSSAMALLSAIDAEIDERISTGRNEPAICLAIDELSELLEGDTVAQGWLSRVARMGRELGIFILAGTQKPLMEEIGQMKSQLSLRLVGRMRSGKDAETAAGTRIDADALYHPGSFFAVTGADTAVLFRGLYPTQADVRHACAMWEHSGASALTVSATRGDNGKEVVRGIAGQKQAEIDAERLQATLNGGLQTASMRAKIQALGLNPAGNNFYVGKERVERALEVLTTTTPEADLDGSSSG